MSGGEQVGRANMCVCVCATLQGKIESLLCRRNEVLEADPGAAGISEGTADHAADFEVRISDAHRKVESMRKRFERLRTVCISADQALKGMLARSKVALHEMHPSELTPASKIPHGTPPRATKRLERKERYATDSQSYRQSFFLLDAAGGLGCPGASTNASMATVSEAFWRAVAAAA